MSGVGPIAFNNSEFKPCDPTKPGPVDCVMAQQTGSWKQSRVFANQSWPASVGGGNLAAWHTGQALQPTAVYPSSTAFGYFNSTQQDACGSAFRVGIDNTCYAGGPVTPAMLSPPFSKNPGPWNMDTGKYLFQLTEPVPPLTGMSTETVLVQDKDVGVSDAAVAAGMARLMKCQ